MDDTYVATWFSSCVCGQLLSSVDGTGSLALFTSANEGRGNGKTKTEYDKQQSQTAGASQRGMQDPACAIEVGPPGRCHRMGCIDHYHPLPFLLSKKYTPFSIQVQ